VPTHHTTTLGAHLSGQLRRLRAVVGMTDLDGKYEDSLHDLLGPAWHRLLTLPPPSPSFVSDDHTPAEFSLAFSGAARPTVRVLVEPGSTGATLAENGHMGWEALERLALRWGFSTDPLRGVADLFFPATPDGDFALWCALDLRSSEAPGTKVYVNPRACGPELSEQIVEEALARCGYMQAWPRLRHAAARVSESDEFRFFAMDLGHWKSPRTKVYIAHHGVDANSVAEVSRMLPGKEHPQQVAEFCRTAGGRKQFDRRPLLSCLTFAREDLQHPSGYTLHVPVRDYAADDQVARDRAVAALERHGLRTRVLDRALAAMTPRQLTNGVGLISYLALVVQSRGRPPRATVYLCPEAYRVRPPQHSFRQELPRRFVT
jgi:DMATS type aromatic prenyltransferase